MTDSELKNCPCCHNNDGWIEWFGGEMPVPKNTKIQVKYRDGSFESGVANMWRFGGWSWKSDAPFQIIAYRIIEKPKTRDSSHQLLVDALEDIKKYAERMRKVDAVRTSLEMQIRFEKISLAAEATLKAARGE